MVPVGMSVVVLVSGGEVGGGGKGQCQCFIVDLKYLPSSPFKYFPMFPEIIYNCFPKSGK